MGRTKQTTPRKRATIIQYTKDGWTQRQIAEKFQIPKSTVGNIVKRFNITGSSDAGKSTGRPRITSKRQDSLIKRSATKNPSLSSLEIKLDTACTASTRTIRRRLVEDFGLRARRPARKPLLTRAQRLQRIAFCKKYKHWTGDDWSKVLFSDESTFCQLG